MNLIDLNLVASLLLAITSLGTFSFLHINGGSPHHKSFTLFWGALCVLLTLNFFMMRCGIKNPAASLTLDVFANASLFLAAYSLFKGEAFSWRDKTFMISAVASVALSMLILLLGTIWRGDSLVWNLFYNSPSALFAAVAFVFIAIAVFRDPALTAIRWPLTILFGLYAFLQIPAYICFFAEVPSLQAELNEARDTIALFIAAGKFSLWFGFVTAIVVQCSDMHGATRVTNAAKWTMSLLSLGLLAVILIHRATQVKAINAEKPVEITVSLAEKIDPALPSMQASLRWD